MKIQSIQKVIKIGSSAGVTLPARDLKFANIEVGDEVEVTVTPINSSKDKKAEALLANYESFKKQYAKTLKNLSNR